MLITLSLALVLQAMRPKAYGRSSRVAYSSAGCEVGRIALSDMPQINHNRSFDAYYSDTDPLLRACPNLRRYVPAGYPLANEEAVKRASVHAPALDQLYVRPSFVYSVGVPELSADLHEATVQMGYTCTWLCGATFVARYVRVARRWRREGSIRMTAGS